MSLITHANDCSNQTFPGETRRSDHRRKSLLASPAKLIAWDGETRRLPMGKVIASSATTTI